MPSETTGSAKWEVVRRKLDPRSNGLMYEVFPFGETLQEILTASGEGSVEGIEAQAKGNPRFHKWFEQMKASGMYSEELLSKGDAAPLGVVQSEIIENARTKLVGRQIASILRTTDTKIRLYRRKGAVAKRAHSASRSMALGAGYDTIDIDVDTEIEETAEWTRTFVEDVPFNVALDEASDITDSLGEQEGVEIFQSLETAVDGAPASHNSADADPWIALTVAKSGIDADNGRPDFIVIHGGDTVTFWQNDKFIHNFYFGNQFDVQSGMLGRLYLGLRVVQSNQVNAGTAGEAHIGAQRYVKMALRRDILTEPYQMGKVFGYTASSRLGTKDYPRYKGRTLDHWDFGKLTGV